MYFSLLLQVNWHDFAFFDPVMYESLRQLIRHSQAGEADAVFAAMDLAFAIDLCKEEGAGQVKDYAVIVSPKVDVTLNANRILRSPCCSKLKWHCSKTGPACC